MEIININPKYCSIYRSNVVETDYSKLLGTKNLIEIAINSNSTLIIPKYYWSDNNGFALKSYKDRICFNRGIVISTDSDIVNKLMLEVFWLKNNLSLKRKEESRLYNL